MDQSTLEKPVKTMPLKDLPYKNKGDLTTGPVQAHLIRLTIPMIWGLLAIMSVALVDTYFVSRLGTHALVGISFTFPVTLAIANLLFGLNIALSSVVSRLIGEKKLDDARRVTLHGILLAVLAAFIIALGCYIFMDPLFRALGADAESLAIVRAFMPVWLLSSVVLAIPVNANSAIRANGDTYTASLVMLAIAVSNLIFNPIFIFGLLGMPAFGVTGSAIATLLANICGMIAALYIIIFKQDLLPHDGLHLDKFGNSTKRLAMIAIPAGLTNIIMPATNAVIVAFLASYGSKVVAAFGVVARVEALSLLLVIALAIGMSPLIGQNWGAGKFSRVNETIRLAIIFNFIWSVLMALVFGLFAKEIGGVFSADDVIIHYVALYFWLVPVSYGFGNLVFGWSSAFNAMGEPQRAFFMIAAKSFAMTVPAVLVGSHFYGVPGIFLALALVNIASGVLFHVMSWRHSLRREHQALPV
jgi:putative MATE family efflux protein